MNSLRNSLKRLEILCCQSAFSGYPHQAFEAVNLGESKIADAARKFSAGALYPLSFPLNAYLKSRAEQNGSFLRNEKMEVRCISIIYVKKSPQFVFLNRYKFDASPVE